MKRLILTLTVLLFTGTVCAQEVALKNNLLYDATMTPNLALEVGWGQKSSFDLGVGYNPFKFSDGQQWKHWLVQPEYRWWFCERFNGTFLGVHALGGEYSFAKVDIPLSVFSDLKDFRYEGWYLGVGASVGYQWILSPHWGLEATVGVGYVRVQYDKYNCASCSSRIDNGYKNYFGPTKLALSLVFYL